MIESWRPALVAFAKTPELRPHLLSAEPLIVFARDGSRVLFANPAAARALGTRSFPARAQHRLGTTDPLRRALQNLGRALPPEGTLARLRLRGSLTSLPVLCRCRLLAAGGERGILVAPLEGSSAPPSPAELAAFFTGEGCVAALFDARGSVRAEGIEGAAAGIAEGTSWLEIEQTGETLRLYLLEQAAPRFGRGTAAMPPPMRLDGPGLSAVAASADAPGESGASPPSAAPPEPVPQARPVAERESPASASDSEPAPSAPPSESSTPPPREPPRSPGIVAERPRRAPAEADDRNREKPRTVLAGRAEQDLSRTPVRFLWQTDAADRFLFLSPGLAQVVGRTAEVVGERWQEAAARLRLDPTGRIARALQERDTWSGLTAWWPIEGSNVRVPVELTALPVFGADQSFQGYRGFAVLRPAEALMPAAFEARFGSAPLGEPQPPYEESPVANVVPIRADLERIGESERLTAQERHAFEEIASALRDRIVDALAGVEREDSPAEEEERPTAEIVPLPAGGESRAAPVAGEAEEPPEAPQSPAAAGAAPSPSRESPERASADPPPAADPRLGLLNDQLAEARSRLREMSAILDTATDGVLILDADGRIESANASAEALFGLESHEMAGRSFADLLRPGSREAALDYLSGLRDSGVASLLNEGREVEGSVGAGSVPLFMTMGRISSDEGQRYCAVLREITHWKRLESELTQAKRAAEAASRQKSEFLRRVGSEIRDPLNTIIGLAEEMLEERFGPPGSERHRERLREMRASGEHVVNLVNDLLDVSQVEAGDLELDFEAVSLNALVSEGMALMQGQANRARVVLRSSLSHEVPAIVGDERTLRQVILNLLSHAVRHAGAGGQVIVSTSLSESGEALLRVRDTGHGMSEEEVKRALEPFRELTMANLTGRSGSGLSLPLTKALVEANRAALTIRSARGEGTVLTVTIPAPRVLSE